jgi:tRNA nucleotidyltransferase/poly(A) polymerase
MRMLESGSSAKFMKLLTEHGFLELLAPGLNQCFCSPLSSDMYGYLEALDTKTQDRIVGTACMLLPVLDRYLKTHYEERSRYPHLGEIQDGAYQLIHEAFSPFFVIPKKFKSELAQILSGQFRLTPLEPKKKMRAPHLESMSKTLDLLELRSEIEPALGPIVEKWKHRMSSVSQRKPRHEIKKPDV